MVGAGHLKGMQEKWDADIDMEELMTMPARKQSSGRSWAHVCLLATGGAAVVATVAIAIQYRRRR